MQNGKLGNVEETSFREHLGGREERGLFRLLQYIASPKDMLPNATPYAPSSHALIKAGESARTAGEPGGRGQGQGTLADGANVKRGQLQPRLPSRPAETRVSGTWSPTRVSAQPCGQRTDVQQHDAALRSVKA